MKEKLKMLSKKWWFWVIVVVLVIGVFGSTESDDSLTKYTLTGEQLGEYGKKVVLNENSDMPVTKYLYKLPEGTYKVTTTFEKVASFYVVKDETVNTGNSEYPEELNYVSEAYLLTNGNDNNIKKNVEISIKNDESILIIGTNTFTFEKQ